MFLNPFNKEETYYQILWFLQNVFDPFNEKEIADLLSEDNRV